MTLAMVTMVSLMMMLNMGMLNGGDVGGDDVDGGDFGCAVGDVGAVGDGNVGVGDHLSSLLLLLAVVASRSRNLTCNRFYEIAKNRLETS